jgi:hypothetical protein
MRCEGLQALDPLCQAGQFIQGQANNVVDNAFTRVADSFSEVAMNATTWLWKQINDATTLDLHDPKLLREIGTTAAIAGVLCLGLFVIQVITSVLRREPGGLGRALSGLVVSFVGSALAIAATRTLLGVVDALSAGYVQHTLGTNVEGIGQKFAFTQLANVQAPAATLLLSLVILVAVVLVWAAMMVRKMVLIIAAVLAPLAFAGATADITRAWVRRWIEFVCAMIVSKLLLVIILSIGLAAFNGAGQDGSGVGQSTTQLAAGSLILMMGGFAPWMAMRMFSFAGDTIHAAHATVGQATAGGHAVIAAPQKVSSMAWTASSLGSIARGRPGMVGPPPSSQGGVTQRSSSPVSTSGAPQAPPKFDLARAEVTQPPPAKAVNPPPGPSQTPQPPEPPHD